LLPCNTKLATQKYIKVFTWYAQAQGQKNQKKLLPYKTKVATPKKYTKVITRYAQAEGAKKNIRSVIL
jgi:hypothetical protein